MLGKGQVKRTKHNLLRFQTEMVMQVAEDDVSLMTLSVLNDCCLSIITFGYEKSAVSY